MTTSTNPGKKGAQLQSEANHKRTETMDPNKISSQCQGSSDGQTQRLLKLLEDTLQRQDSKIQRLEAVYQEAMLQKLDKLISVNETMSISLLKLVNKAQLNQKKGPDSLQLDPKKESSNSQQSNILPCYMQDGPETRDSSSKPFQRATSRQNYKDSENADSITGPVIEALTEMTHLEKSEYARGVSTNKLMTVFQRMLEMDYSQEKIAKEINNLVGSFFRKGAAHYFQEYRLGKIKFNDMKVSFSSDIINQMIEISNQWIKFMIDKSSDSLEKCVVRGKDFYRLFEDASMKSLQFLIYKYPPTRTKQVDTQLSERIKEIKTFSIMKNDLLKNADMEFGFTEGQVDFNTQIKTWINRLVTETNKEFPKFRQIMKGIFLNQQESLMKLKPENGVEYLIGRKIPESTPLYTQDEIKCARLQVKNPQILRVLVKWFGELISYFTNTKSRILDNRFGFKSTNSKFISVRIPRSKLEALAHSLQKMYVQQILSTQKDQSMNVGSIIEGLIVLTAGGMQGNEFLDQREMVIIKLSESAYDTFKSHVVRHLNIVLANLVQARFDYPINAFESSINLVTFTVMDLLRCKCTGTKQEIYRIYKQILQRNDYFQVIRVKNKLDQPTRDILINLKLKESFLICEVQLSLGTNQQHVNDHFCHFLYELERSRFGVMFQCAAIVTNLDPRASYIRLRQDIRFKRGTLVHETIISKVRVGNGIFCSLGHKQVKMQLVPSDRPYCCLSCMSFVEPYSIKIPYYKCRKCRVSICHACTNKFAHEDKILIDQTFTREFIQRLEIPTYFFIKEFLCSGLYTEQRMNTLLRDALQEYKYAAVGLIDNIGFTKTVFKNHKSAISECFGSVPQVANFRFPTSTVLPMTFIVRLLPTQMKKLSQLQNMMKYHINYDWCRINQILVRKGIDRVICVVNQAQKSVLIVDIIESDIEIDKVRTMKAMVYAVDEVNKTKDTYIEMTSKNLCSIDLLDKIENKSQITAINLWENKISDIRALKQFPNVQELYVQQNKLEHIDDLLGMTNIQLLCLGDNRLTGSLPVLNMPYLQFLTMDKNNLESVSNLSHSNIQNLIILRITSNLITTLPFLSLPRLEGLYASCCKTKDISEFAKSQLPSLKNLHLSQNLLEGEIPTLKLPQLQQLMLNDNQLSSLAKLKGSNLQKLVYLNVDNNQVTGTVGIVNFPQLRYVSLCNNKIQKIDTKEFKSTLSITQLYLRNNLIACNLPKCNLKSLKKIDLGHNKITDLRPFYCSEVPSLEEAYFDHNQITRLNMNIKETKTRLLDLSHNQIQDIGDLAHLQSEYMQEIRLNNNRITTPIPRMELYALKKINLSNNQIKEERFIQNIHLLPELEDMDLGFNPPELMKSIKSKYPHQARLARILHQ